MSSLLAPSPGIYRVAGIVRSLDRVGVLLNGSGGKLEQKIQLLTLNIQHGDHRLVMVGQWVSVSPG